MSDPAEDTTMPGGPELDLAFRRWRKPLCQYALHLAVSRGLPRSPDSAEDVVQQAFEAALRTGWDTIQRPRAWLYAVTHHLVLHSVRFWKLEGPWSSSTGKVVWTSQTRLPSTVVAHAVSAAADEIAGLPVRQGSVFYLREVLGYSYIEIAAEIGISESTARVHAHHARANLRKTVPQPAAEAWILCGDIGRLGDCVSGDKIGRDRRAPGLRRLLPSRVVAISLVLLSVLLFLVWWLL